LALIDIFIGLAAVALENSRLSEETETKAAALAALNKDWETAVHAKTRFLSTVSHELRSPLVVVTGYANLIIDGTFGPLAPGLSAAVYKIIKQGNHVSALINNLLEAAQLDAMQHEAGCWFFDLRELLNEVVKTTCGLIVKKSVIFEWYFDQEFQPVTTNREKLRQILGHLLDNAVKFTDQGKTVLGARSLPTGIEFWVEDTGVGIEAADLEHLRRL
jgi:signal transduction histidine kinase